MTTTALPPLAKKDFQTDQEVRWCPGCGDYAILSAVQSVFPELGIPRENFLMIASHTHTGPVMYSNLKTMFALNEKEEEVVKTFTRELADHAVAAATAAVRDMKPARIFFTRGKATFAVNRAQTKHSARNRMFANSHAGVAPASHLEV